VKRKILAWLLFLSLVFPAVSFAVDASATLGTIERFKNADGKYVMAVVPITFTANSGTAAEATYSLVPASHNISGWYLLDVYTDPGSTGPSNGLWDLDITNAAGFLVSQNLIDDRSSTATQRVAGVSLGYPSIWSTWSITIGDNAVNSAVAIVYLIFVAP
jgi:hypothetical protein